MSKTSLCMELLKVLYSRGHVVGAEELAEILETNKRNISEYINELRDMGYYIQTVQGRYGGYLLNRHSVFPALKLTTDEQNALINGYEYLLLRNDFLEKKQLGKAMGKICSSIMKTDAEVDCTLIANRFPLAMSEEELTSRYLAIKQCINNKNVFHIEYQSLDESITLRNIHPYKLYMYNNAWFVIAFDESKGDIRYFKINRITKFNILDKKFRVLYSYVENDYLDEYGMKNNGQWYDIKLKISGKYKVLMQERIYGKEQSIQVFDDYIILSCKMQNKQDIEHFVLSLADSCEVIQPTWLKQSIIDLGQKIIDINK